MKRLFSVLKHNTTILILACLVCLSLLVIIKNPTMFEASVLNAHERTIIQQEQWDLAYKTTENVLDIFVSEQLPPFKEITLSLRHDPRIELSSTGRISQGSYSILGSGDERFLVHINQFSGFQKNQSLLIVPFSGTNKQILVEEAYITFDDTSTKDLAIGNLSEKITHN